MISFLNRLGLLKSFKPLKTRLLAEAMLRGAKTADPGEYTIANTDIQKSFH